MTNAEFLTTYRDKNNELRMLERQLLLTGDNGAPKGVFTANYDPVQRYTNDRDAADRQQSEGLAADIQEMRAQLAAMTPRFQALLKSTNNYRDRFILRQYYQQSRSDDYIATCLDISTRHANRLRHELLTTLDAQ